MKIWTAAVGLFFAFIVRFSQSETQPNATPNSIIPDLKAVPDGKVWKGSIDAAKLVETDSSPTIEFNQEGVNVIWLSGFEFTTGTIEFDAKGKSEPPQNGFVGVAFRLVDEVTHDSVYFRPFNFRALDAERRSHAVQYISPPEWPWPRLREEKSSQFEKPIEPAPDGDTWFHVKIVIAGRQIKIFVNNSKEPVMQVTELSDRSGGSVGLWCYGYGVISNFKITPAS